MWTVILAGALSSVTLLGAMSDTDVPASAGLYATIDIPDGRVGCAIKNLGQIAGRTADSNQAQDEAAVWSQENRSSPVAAPIPGRTFSCASSINDNGDVVGTFNGPKAILPFVWVPGGKLEELPLMEGYNGGHAAGINAERDVVGYVSGAAGVRACLWRSGREGQLLDPLPEDNYSRASTVNESGDVVGVSGAAGRRHAVVWIKGALTARDLGTLPGDDASEAVAINKFGDIVGSSEGPKGTRAFLWNEANGMQDIGASTNCTRSEAFAVSDSGAIVGAFTNNRGSHAFIWTQATGMQDLNEKISRDDISLISAYAINNNGQIMVHGVDRMPCDAGGAAVACPLSACAPMPKYELLLTAEP